jgi:hypothetical protein
VFPEPYQDPSLALDGGGRPWVVAVRWRERDHHATAPKLRQAHPKATAIGVPFTPGNLGLLHLAFVNGKPAVTHAAFGEGDHSVGGVFLTRKR